MWLKTLLEKTRLFDGKILQIILADFVETDEIDARCEGFLHLGKRRDNWVLKNVSVDIIIEVGKYF